MFLKESDGGRASMPVGSGYPPHFVIEDTQNYLGVRFIDVPSSARQGEEFITTIELMYPEKVDYSKLVQGARFLILEGTRVVGKGVVVVSEHES